MSYTDPEDVKALFRMARHGRDREGWKKAFQARRKAREAWQKEKLESACKGDGGSFRKFKKKINVDWERHFADANHDSHKVIHEHLQGIYSSEETVKETPPELPFREITMDELRYAVYLGKNNVSVSHDGTSRELLVGIMQSTGGPEALLIWFNNLLRIGIGP